MFYVCVENGRVVGMQNLKPNVPESVQVIEITDEEYKKINEEDTHRFNTETMKVEMLPKEVFDQREIEEQNRVYQRYLNSTDWMVLRHLRQKELGIETSLTDEEFRILEAKRQDAATSIIK